MTRPSGATTVPKTSDKVVGAVKAGQFSSANSTVSASTTNRNSVRNRMSVSLGVCPRAASGAPGNVACHRWASPSTEDASMRLAMPFRAHADTRWLAAAAGTACLLAGLGVPGPVVFGPSWGALVALAMGLRCPQDVGSLVLASGYYFPTVRLNAALLGAPALPGIGALLRHTISPLLNRLLWPVMV